MSKIIKYEGRQLERKPITLDYAKTSGQIGVKIAFPADNVAILNSTAAKVWIAVGALISKPKDAVGVEAFDYLAFPIEEAQEFTLFWEGTITSGECQLVLIFSNEEIHVQGGSMKPSTVAAITTLGSEIPAGTKKIGSVDLASAIPAGNNNIGNVDVVTLPELPAGANTIGKVKLLSPTDVALFSAASPGVVGLDSLTPLPAGTNTLGKVKILDNAGSNIFTEDVPGNVKLATDFHLPAGTNVIGKVRLVDGSDYPFFTGGSPGVVTLDSLTPLPAGTNNIGAVSLSGSNLKWTPIALVDEAVGNDKIFTVPASTEYEVLSIAAFLTADATVGDRVIHVAFSTDNVGLRIARYTAGFVITASNNVWFTFAPDVAKETAIELGGNNATVPMARMVLPAGYIVRVHDINNISTGDTLKVYMQTRQRTV